MNTHENINELLVGFVLEELSEEQRTAVKTHLAECQQCSSELRRLEVLLECTGRMEKLRADENICESAKEALFASIGSEEMKEPTPGLNISPAFIWRTIMKSRISKLATAVVIIIAIMIGINYFGGSIDGTSKVYAMSDVPELFQSAKTIHMKGRMYFPSLNPGKEQASVEVEYWLDKENGRWRLTYPGYSSDSESIKIHLSENVSDGEYEMRVNHTEKLVSFSKLSAFQRRLFAHKNVYTYLELLYVNFELFDYTKIGDEIIDGEFFQIWQGLREDSLGTKMKLKSWLSPTTGNFARIKSWAWTKDEDWEKRMEIDSVERDIEVPDNVFVTEAPVGYALENSKETATVRELINASVGTESVTLNCHILFAMSDGSVIVGWSSEDRQSDASQEVLFEGLQMGGQLPKVATEVYAIKTSDREQEITYRGYHLAHTKKKGKFYEWSIYVADKQVSPSKVLGYSLVHRYNPENRVIKAKISISTTATLIIDNAEDFDTFVLGSMAELSDDGRVPEELSYENVLQLAQQIRNSLSE